MTEDQTIKHMVNRFLSWKLPEDFRPDAGISFKADFNENTAYPMKHEPSGTNLFDATQAEAMVRHMVEGANTLVLADKTDDQIEAEMLRLRTALAWYADKAQYEPGQDCEDIMIDGGAIARRALGEYTRHD